MVSIWITAFFNILLTLSKPARQYIKAGFDFLRQWWTSQTTTKIDDALLCIIEAIVLGEYTTTGTGKLEQALAILLEKATPAVRAQIYDTLVKVREECRETPGEADDKAIQFVIDVLFPQGRELAPEEPDSLPETSAGPGAFPGTRSGFVRPNLLLLLFAAFFVLGGVSLGWTYKISWDPYTPPSDFAGFQILVDGEFAADLPGDHTLTAWEGPLPVQDAGSSICVIAYDVAGNKCPCQPTVNVITFDPPPGCPAGIKAEP